ncbi:hypothetical protein KIW84_041062 [Lathyrus oleraceus]|uniref:Uncharacterized protein n=1 Tax=Pisum sativum TaxID=3888 RepID=A0A9D5ARM6_PEA|nr:hypothetical protein KIW84_041062 [Pisum sativum]
MRLNEVVADVRLRFAIEITGCMAFKARQLARQVVEGDLSKQCTLLWSYGTELRKASPGNTFKLNIGRTCPGLEPHFERCYMCFDGTEKALTLECRPFIWLYGCHLKNNKVTYYEAHEDNMMQVKEYQRKGPKANVDVKKGGPSKKKKSHTIATTTAPATQANAPDEPAT